MQEDHRAAALDDEDAYYVEDFNDDDRDGILFYLLVNYMGRVYVSFLVLSC